MEVKKIVEGMTAVEVAEVIDSNFKNQNKILEDDIQKQNNAIGVSEYKAFSEVESVDVGAVRLYNGVLYECVEATTGAFDASKWKKSSFKAETEKKLSELASEVKGFASYDDNPEFIRAVVDKDGRLLYGVDKDGYFVFGKGIPKEISELLNKKIDNPEFIRAVVDKDGVIIRATAKNGEEIHFSKSHFKKGFDLGGKETYPLVLAENYKEVVCDANGVIIRIMLDNTDEHHYNKQIFHNFTLTPNSASSFLADLRAKGFDANVGNWSNAEELSIPMPRCAMVNITNDANNAIFPNSKTMNYQYWMEFWDMQGNYFRKRVIFNAQGNSSMAWDKKNAGFDICNDEWIGDNTFRLKIGEWVPQDSFHMKAYYSDAFRAGCPISYKIFNEISKTRGVFNDYVWKRALIDFDSISVNSNGANTLDESLAKFDNGARCFPDGFPCIMYLNGEFWGVYSFQLKKHRDNYHMSKSNANHIHLDGVINDEMIFGANGNATEIGWNPQNDGGFEIRNPKDLYLMDGTKYDADTNTGELIDSTSSHYDASNSKMVRTNQVKNFILELSKYKNQYESLSTDAEKKTFLEKRFDIANIVDYIILSDVVKNIDGFSKNWQWLTYDGVKWYITPYDIDLSFGNLATPSEVKTDPLTKHSGNTFVIGYVLSLYKKELNERWAELRSCGIITPEHITQLMNEWISNVGYDNYVREYEKWNKSARFDSIFRFNKWITQEIANMDILYNYNV